MGRRPPAALPFVLGIALAPPLDVHAMRLAEHVALAEVNEKRKGTALLGVLDRLVIASGDAVMTRCVQFCVGVVMTIFRRYSSG